MSSLLAGPMVIVHVRSSTRFALAVLRSCRFEIEIQYAYSFFPPLTCYIAVIRNKNAYHMHLYLVLVTVTVTAYNLPGIRYVYQYHYQYQNKYQYHYMYQTKVLYQ